MHYVISINGAFTSTNTVPFLDKLDSYNIIVVLNEIIVVSVPAYVKFTAWITGPGPLNFFNPLVF